MSANSSIEWTDATWSPTLGCKKVSPGCDNCYAIRTVHRLSFNPNPKVHEAAEGLTAYRPGVGTVWTGDVRTLPSRLDVPLHWRKPRRIFVDSQSDLFHEQVPDEFIWSVWVTMARTPRHTYQILTKRHGRMRSLLQRWAAEGWEARDHRMSWNDLSGHVVGGALPNVWLGVSAEDQKRADLRIPALLATPAAVRWVSAEPLLGSVDLTSYLTAGDCPGCGRNVTSEVCGTDQADAHYALGVNDAHLDWVVAGGESGAAARPMHADWSRSLRDQCVAASVPFLFKQWGDSAPLNQLPDAAAASWEIRHGTGYPGATMCQVGKKAAGRELDGEKHDGYPAVAS